MTACLSVLGAGAIHNISDDYNKDNPPPPVLNTEENTKLSTLFPKAPLRRIPPYARMGLLACAKALEGYDNLPIQSMGLVVGTAYAGIKMSMDFMDSILDAEPRLSSPTAFSHAVNNMGAGLLSLYLGLQGPCHTVTQFELSFAGAIQAANSLIYSGRAPYVLVGCMDESDPRFSKVCPEKGIFEGAAFLLVTKEQANLPKICVNFHAQASPEQFEPSSLHSAVASVDALIKQNEKIIFCKSNNNLCASIHIEI